MGDISLDEREFADAFRSVLAAVPKDEVKLLDKRALQVIIGSGGHPGVVKLSPEADPAKIKAVPRRVIAGYVIAKAKKKGQWPLSSAEIDRRIDKEYARRLNAIAYTRGPAWLPAAKALGAAGVKNGKKGQAQPGFDKSKAAHGYARRASIGLLEVTIANTAPAAVKVSGEPLQRAVDGQAADMNEYAAKELLKKTFDRHSAK